MHLYVSRFFRLLTKVFRLNHFTNKTNHQETIVNNIDFYFGK